MWVHRDVQFHRSPAPCFHQHPSDGHAPKHSPADPINHCTSPTQANRLGTDDRASYACTGLDPVLTSGRGEVADRTRKLGSGSAQNSGSPTEPRCRSPDNAGPTRKSSAHLENRAWRVWRRRRRTLLWRKRLRVAGLRLCCARAVRSPALPPPPPPNTHLPALHQAGLPGSHQDPGTPFSQAAIPSSTSVYALVLSRGCYSEIVRAKV